MSPIVLGIAGAMLTDEERTMIRQVGPAGFILFARNIVDPAQLLALTTDLCAVTGRADLPVMVDQEGGPVARLRPPHWPAFPGAARFAAAYREAPMTAIQAARANGEALGHVLASVGITMNAAPVLDLGHVDTEAGLAARTLGADPLSVAALGRALVEGMASAGVVSILKHLPGQGRATVDAHRARPVVTATADALAIDLAPFRRLAGQGAPAAMIGHVVYTAWDAARPASQSPVVIDRIVRGAIGFDGLLLSDDLHMDALAGPIEERAVAAIAAGCDLALCCHVAPAEALRIAARLGPMTTLAERRLARAVMAKSRPGDAGEAIARRDTLLAASNVADRLAMPGGNA